MCKKCKGCGKSNLGAIVTHVEKIAVRVVDGVVTEQFQDSYEEKETMEVNYCFECGKEITAADLYEEVQCPICGKMVGGLTESGACQACTDEANKLSSMSKEQLILMLMKQAHAGNSVPVTAPAAEDIPQTPHGPVTGNVVASNDNAVKANTPKEKKEEEIKVDTTYVEDTMNAKENLEAEETVNTQPKKTRSRKKSEPADITEDALSKAKEENVEKLEDVEVTTGTDPATIKDNENNAALTSIDDKNAVPTPNASDEVDNILEELDKINLSGGNTSADENNVEGDIF